VESTPSAAPVEGTHVMAVKMELSRIFIREMTDLQFIELQESGGSRSFPIAIGLPEAQAIERRLKGIEPQRPQTHDLLGQVIEAFGARVDRVTITDLDDNTFFAKITIEGPGDRRMDIDSRPSDAIALGAALAVPIYVEDAVLEQAATEEA